VEKAGDDVGLNFQIARLIRITLDFEPIYFSETLLLAAKKDEPARKAPVEPANKGKVEPTNKATVEPASKATVEPARKVPVEPEIPAEETDKYKTGWSELLELGGLSALAEGFYDGMQMEDNSSLAQCEMLV